MSSLPNPPNSISSSKSQSLTCSICTDTYNKAVLLTKCGHSFCRKCIKEWLKRKYECPNCRKVPDSKRPYVPNYALRENDVDAGDDKDNDSDTDENSDVEKESDKEPAQIPISNCRPNVQSQHYVMPRFMDAHNRIVKQIHPDWLNQGIIAEAKNAWIKREITNRAHNMNVSHQIYQNIEPYVSGRSHEYDDNYQYQDDCLD